MCEPEERRGLVVERLRLEPRHPVDRVLEGRPDRPVVFGRGEEQRVRREDLVAQLRRRSRETLLLDVEVVDRKLADARDAQLQAGRHQLPRRPEGGHVVGLLPEASADAEHLKVSGCVHVFSFRLKIGRASGQRLIAAS